LIVDVCWEFGVGATVLFWDSDAVVFGHAGVRCIEDPPEAPAEFAF
jgi:hypothetical protein